MFAIWMCSAVPDGRMIEFGVRVESDNGLVNKFHANEEFNCRWNVELRKPQIGLDFVFATTTTSLVTKNGLP